MSICVRRVPLALAGLAFLATCSVARATEGGAGHYIVGTDAASGAGIVPPSPGVYWSNTDLYYGVSGGKNLQIPVGGNLAAGLRADFSSFSFTGLYVPPLGLGPFTFATALTIPGQYIDAQGTVGARTRSDTSGGLGDILISPLIVGWHSGEHFVQARLDIFVPTAGYNRGSLANIGMGYYTFTPTLAYSFEQVKLGLDVSTSVGIDFNTRNQKTGYQSGALLHADSSVTKTVGSTGLALGMMASMLYQIEDDSGALATLLGGFRGQSFSVGPVGRYGFKIGDIELSTQLRWAPEFATRNRLSGNAVYLTVSGKF